MNFIFSAMLSNLSFAFADNLVGLVSKKNKPLQIALWTTVFGTLIFFIPAVTIFGGELSRLTFANAVLMLDLNVLVNIGYLLFVTGMSKGSVTITGVIASSYPAITIPLAIIIFGETISPLQALAIVLIVIGVGLASMHSDGGSAAKKVRRSALLCAFGALLCWGIYFSLIRIPIEQIGWFWPQYTSNILGLIIFWAIAMRTKDKQITKRPKMVWLVALAASLQVIGASAFNYAISQGPTSIVAPIAGSAPVVFVILAFILFREKLNRKQLLGITAAIVGLVSLSILSS